MNWKCVVGGLAVIAAGLAACAGTGEAAVDAEVPPDVLAIVGEWSAAVERHDGSVTDLYWSMGYHVYGDRIIARDEIAGHFGDATFPTEWITDPYLIAAEPEGRYVVTRGLRTTLGDQSFASAFTFEILDVPGDGLKIAQTNWMWDNSWRYTEW